KRSKRVFLNDQSAGPRRVSVQHRIAGYVVQVRIEPGTIASHGESYILIWESRHRGIDNLSPCIKHVGGGIASGKPCSHLRRGVGHGPVFAVSISEACSDYFYRGIA